MAFLSASQFDNSYHRLQSGFYTEVEPRGLPNPRLVAVNPEAARLLGVDPDTLHSDEFLAWASGNGNLPGSQPLAMVYSGHQFGVFAGQLGDGRGLLLGEVNGPTGHWDLHLKGAGKTPYSRFGDGRAVLRSCIREYLCSEAMAGLGIASTRALSITGSSEPVFRETVETAAMLIRLARTHVRFGTIEHFYYNNRLDDLRTLLDYCLDRHLPECRTQPSPYLALFRHAVLATADLIAHWQAVGFSHGVMNTDNMSLLGETLDYGPFGFMEAYDPGYICNHSDHSGRYAFQRQPWIGLWNCNALAQAMSPFIAIDDLKWVLAAYEDRFMASLLALQRQKLGLQKAIASDSDLIQGLLQLMYQDRVDYSILFRRLSRFDETLASDPLRDLFIDTGSFDRWAASYRQRLALEDRPRQERQWAMKQVNPKYVLRNYMAEIAIRKACDDGDFSEIETLRQLLASPFDEHPDLERYARHPPDWAGGLSVSCSS